MTTAPASTGFRDRPSLSPRARVLIFLAVALLHVGLGIAIMTGLAGRTMALVGGPNAAIAAYSVPLDPPPPAPAPAPASQPAGAEGAAAKRAKPKSIVAAPARIPNRAAIASPVASTGDATRSGANNAGTGTGGGAAGSGTVYGGSGDGFGAGGSSAVKIAGDITATRDYPARTRGARIGTSVIVALTVGTDGRVRGCRILQPSPDADADAITCRLARERFRFRPATNRAGNPIESEFGWRQRWFAP